MANRVSEQELREYLPGVPSSVSLAQYLDDANALVAAKMGPTPGIGESLAKLVEKNLAAHLYTVTQERGGVVEKTVGESSERYAASTTKEGGIGSTSFGQMVLSLAGGAFDDMNGVTKKKAQFRVL